MSRKIEFDVKDVVFTEDGRVLVALSYNLLTNARQKRDAEILQMAADMVDEGYNLKADVRFSFKVDE